MHSGVAETIKKLVRQKGPYMLTGGGGGGVISLSYRTIALRSRVRIPDYYRCVHDCS